MAARPDKIYFNITLNYNDKKLIAGDRNTSRAESQIEVIDPLVENTNQYDLCISKFRLDTLTIPLVIPELKQPQKIVDTKIELNYWVKLIKSNDSEFTDGNKSFKEVSQAYLTLIPKNSSPGGKIERNGGEKYFNSLESYKIKKPYVKGIDETNAFVDNLNPFCYIYEAQEFVDSINRAIAETMEGNIEDEEIEQSQSFFLLEGGTLKFYQKARRLPYYLVFSPNLYKYFGLGFNTKRFVEYGGWSIANDVDSRNYINKHEFSFYTNIIANPEFTGENPLLLNVNEFYNTATSQFSVTQTWNACKLILICSSSLPVRGEYIPTSENDGLLIHEPTEQSRKYYTELHDGKKDASCFGEPSIKTPSIKVLESFYPASSIGGDMRTQIIFSNDTMDTSTKHSMQGENASLKKFDISVKWLDIYNNMHDLELMDGSSCDIRIAFVKKSVKQDLVLTGFKEVIKALNGEYFDEPPLKKPTSNSFKLKNGGFKFDLDEFI